MRKGAYLHCKCALTGAAANRAGLFRINDTGVLFLDEIGELGFYEQAMVLRVTEDNRSLPVGVDTYPRLLLQLEQESDSKMTV